MEWVRRPSPPGPGRRPEVGTFHPQQRFRHSLPATIVQPQCCLGLRFNALGQPSKSPVFGIAQRRFIPVDRPSHPAPSRARGAVLVLSLRWCVLDRAAVNIRVSHWIVGRRIVLCGIVDRALRSNIGLFRWCFRHDSSLWVSTHVPRCSTATLPAASPSCSGSRRPAAGVRSLTHCCTTRRSFEIWWSTSMTRARMIAGPFCAGSRLSICGRSPLTRTRWDGADECGGDETDACRRFVTKTGRWWATLSPCPRRSRALWRLGERGCPGSCSPSRRSS